MEMAVERMEAQLKRWSLKIDTLAARTQMAGARPSFEDLTYIDELKVLQAIAQSKLIEYKAVAVGGVGRSRLKAEMKSAWNELEAAFRNPNPSA